MNEFTFCSRFFFKYERNNSILIRIQSITQEFMYDHFARYEDFHKYFTQKAQTLAEKTLSKEETFEAFFYFQKAFESLTYENFRKFQHRYFLMLIFSEMEQYLYKCFKFLLFKNPVHLYDKVVSIKELHNAGFNSEEILEEIIEKELHDKFYMSYIVIFSYAFKKLGIKHTISKDEIEKLEEFKLLRNQFVHADGRINHVYLRKTRKRDELGIQGELKTGEEIELTDSILEVISNLVRTILLRFDKQLISQYPELKVKYEKSIQKDIVIKMDHLLSFIGMVPANVLFETTTKLDNNGISSNLEAKPIVPEKLKPSLRQALTTFEVNTPRDDFSDLDTDLLVKLGIAHRELGEHAQAIRYFQAAIEIEPTYNAYFQLSHEFWQIKEYVESEKLLLKLLEDNEEDAHLWKVLGMNLFDQGRIEDAENAFHTAIDLQSNYFDIWLQLSIAYSKQGKEELAERTIRKAIKRFPDEVNGWYFLGIILQSQKRTKEAEKAYRTAIKCQPEYSYAWNNLGNLLLEENRFDEAKEVFFNGVNSNPDNTTLLNNLGFIFGKLKRYQDAEKYFRRVLELNPKDIMSLSNLGNTLSLLKQDEEAEGLYRTALKYEPKNPDLWFNLGRHLDIHARDDEAELAYRNVVKYQPKHIDAWLRIKNLFSKQKRHIDAKKVLFEALDTNKNDIQLVNSLGVVLLEQNELREAEEVFMKCLEIDEDQDSAWFNLACLHAIQGNISSAIYHLKQSFELNPFFLSKIDESQYFDTIRNDTTFQALIREVKNQLTNNKEL